MSEQAPPQAVDPPTRRPRWQRILAEVALVAALVMGVRAYQQRALPDDAAPTLRGVDLAGAQVDLADYGGRPVLVHFWATWCGVCDAEAPNIEAIAKDYPVLTVASQSGGASAVRAHMAARGLSFRTLQDRVGMLAHRFGVRAYPTTFVIDAEGHIAHAEVGYTTELGLRARMWLADH